MSQKEKKRCVIVYKDCWPKGLSTNPHVCLAESSYYSDFETCPSLAVSLYLAYIYRIQGGYYSHTPSDEKCLRERKEGEQKRGRDAI